MSREDAEATCARLAAEHPDRGTHHWVPHQAANGDWTVAKVALPPRSQESTAETRADERPPTPDDPRPMRDTGGPWVAGA